MTTHSTPMQHPTGKRTVRKRIYVLWGDGFDELTAVTAITLLRQAGHQVKLVGLRRQPIAGAYGVMLFPEIGLDDALAKAASFCGLVVPCTEAGWQRLQLEPRVGQLLAASAPSAPLLLVCCSADPCVLETFQQCLSARN